jgi:threonine/homoserine efflux transporter RhtA
LRRRKEIRERLGSRERKGKRETKEKRATAALRAAKVTREIGARLAPKVFPALPAKLVSRGREDQKALLDRLVLLDATARTEKTEDRDAYLNIESRMEL